MKKKYLKKIFIYLLLFVVLGIVYLISRLPNLTLIPIFTDEAIYLRWAQIALGDPRWRFISLIDGKQPLFIWFLLPMLKFIADPLVAGRLLSVGAGFVAMMGMAAFGWILTKSHKGAFISGLLYLVIPFYLMYDRLAIYDAFFGAIAIWTFILLYLYGKYLRLDLALVTGIAIGAGLLTKSYAYYFLILLPLTWLLIDWRKKMIGKTLVKWFAFSGVILIQAEIYNNIQRLSEFRHYIGAKNLQFLYSFSEFIANPRLNFTGNLSGLSRWLIDYITVPVGILILISCYWLVRKNWRLGLYFILWFLGPFLSLALFGKVIYPRFILFMTFPLLMPLVLFMHDLWQKMKHKVALIFLGILLLLPALRFDWLILTDPIRAPLTNSDRQQFINDWPAGYGIKEVVNYLNEESKKHSLVIGTEGTFGLFPMALELYFVKNVNVTVKPYWPLSDFPQELSDIAKTKPTYLVFKERQAIPEEWPIKLINQYQRGDGPTFLKFYQVIPKS